MSGFISFVVENRALIVGAAVATLGAAAAIAKLTPSPKDDGVVASLLTFFKLVPVKRDDA